MSSTLQLSRLELIRDEVTLRIGADDYFSDVPVLTERKGDINAEIDKALGTYGIQAGTKAGACILVTTPLAGCTKLGIPVPVLDETSLAVTVIEDVLINTGSDGTLKSALDIACHVLGVMWLYQGKGGLGAIAPDKKTIRLAEDAPKGKLAYNIFFTFNGGKADSRAKLVEPSIATDAQAKITLSASSGADIWFTTDGTYPAPKNTAATKYSTPFSLPIGAVSVRAVAYKTGSIASDVAWRAA